MSESPSYGDREHEFLMHESLIAYRLGRVEKLVEEYHIASNIRDEQIMSKLDLMNTTVTKVTENSYRINKIENSVNSMYKFITAVALLVIAVVINLLVKVLGGISA